MFRGRSTPKARQRSHKRREAGFSLVETLTVLAIVGMLLGGAMLGVRALVKSELRSTASRLAGAIRYSYDRAISTGSYFRLHFNLDDQTYRLERSDTRVVLERREDPTRNGRGRDRDEEAAKARQEEETEARNAGLPPELLPPPSPRRPKFAEYKDSTLPEVKLKRVRVLDLVTPRQPEPYERGHAYLHFFPDGHTERAVIHLGADAADDDQYSLIIHGLTGRVEVLPGRVLPPPDFEAGDSDTPRGGS